MGTLLRRRIFGELISVPDYYDYQVKYIENTTGDEVIDTGFIPTNRTSISCEAAILNKSNSASTGSNFNCGSNNWQEFGYGFDDNNSQTSIYVFLGSSYNQVRVSLSYETKYKFEIRSSNNGTLLTFYLNGSSRTSKNWTKGDTSAPVTLSISGGHASTGYGQSKPMRLYSFKIWENDILVRDFIPVVKNGVAGMWDNVRNKFHGNAKNTTTFFTAGPSMDGKMHKVEYLQSSGTQYINTNENPTSNTKFVVDGQYTSSSNYSDSSMAGMMYNGRFHMGLFLSKFHFGIGNSYANGNNYNTNRHVFELNSTEGKGYVDSTSTTVGTGLNLDIPIYLFARNNNSSISYGICKIYLSKIYKNNILVKNFIPVRINEEGYLYDTINHQLYFNEGSGTFTYGLDIGDGKVWIKLSTLKDWLAPWDLTIINSDNPVLTSDKFPIYGLAVLYTAGTSAINAGEALFFSIPYDKLRMSMNNRLIMYLNQAGDNLVFPRTDVSQRGFIRESIDTLNDGTQDCYVYYNYIDSQCYSQDYQRGVVYFNRYLINAVLDKYYVLINVTDLPINNN